jgi:hypothetical protein
MDLVGGGTMKIHGYPKLWTWPQAQVETILDGEFVIQEKYDGSQFSFGLRDGVVHFRSRGAAVEPETTDKLFSPVVTHIRERTHLLREGWTYRGEAFRGPRHNTKTYERTPAGHFVLFDVEPIPGKFLCPALVKDVAALLGVEPVRTIFEGSRLPETVDFVPWSVWLEGLLDQYSTLGAEVLIEGIVIKAYDQLTRLGQVMMAKVVSPEFKEQHKSNKDFKKGVDYATALAGDYRTEARWRKAVSHLRDEGTLESSPRDIGPLLAELQRDFEQECADNVGRQFWAHYRKTILKGIGRGFPEWYKAELRRGVDENVDTGFPESNRGEPTTP